MIYHHLSHVSVCTERRKQLLYMINPSGLFANSMFAFLNRSLFRNKIFNFMIFKILSGVELCVGVWAGSPWTTWRSCSLAPGSLVPSLSWACLSLPSATLHLQPFPKLRGTDPELRIPRQAQAVGRGLRVCQKSLKFMTEPHLSLSLQEKGNQSGGPEPESRCFSDMLYNDAGPIFGFQSIFKWRRSISISTNGAGTR